MATGDKLVNLDSLKTAYDASAKFTARMEVSSTASAAHIPGTSSEYFIYNGTLYIATADIASGATITPNTNCRAVPSGIGGEVSDLKSALKQDENIYDEILSVANQISVIPVLTFSNYTISKNADDTFTYSSNTKRMVSSLLDVSVFNTVFHAYLTSNSYRFRLHYISAAMKILNTTSYYENTDATLDFTLPTNTKYIIIEIRNADAQTVISPSEASNVTCKFFPKLSGIIDNKVEKNTVFTEYPATIRANIRKNAGYVKLNGSIGTSDLQHWVYSDPIPCTSGMEIDYSLYGTTNVASISFYDSSNAIISASNVVSATTNTIIEGTVTAPSNAVSFVVCNFYFEYSGGYAEWDGLMTLLDVVLQVKELAENPISDWAGKSAAIKGDSISVGTYTPAGGGEMEVTDSYIVRALTALEMSYTNYSVNGICISGQGTSSHPERAICITYANMSSNVDLVIIAAGTNDYGTDVPMGTIADTTDISFYGAMNVLCSGLSTKYADKKVLFITPLNRVNENTANNVGKVLQDYRNAIMEVCTAWGFDYIEGTKMGVHAQNATYASTHIYDGTHPNPITHEAMGKTLKRMLLAH